MKTLYLVVVFVFFACYSTASNLLAGDDFHYLYVAPDDTYKVYTNLEDAMIFPNRVQALRLRDMSLDEIPEEVLLFENLVYLDLSGNNILLSDQDVRIIHYLKNLKCLILNRNNIVEIHNNFISGLSNSLIILGLRDNKINIFSIEEPIINNIEFLDLSKNPLDDFPISILKLRQIVRLWLTHSKIKSLEIDLTKLAKLRDFNMSDGVLLDVDITLPNSINVISLRNNNLQEFIANLSHCMNLEVVHLQNNDMLMLGEEYNDLIENEIIFRD